MNKSAFKFSAMLVGGALLCIFSFQIGSKFVSISSDRSPAAIPPGTYDFSHLDGTALTQVAQERLLSGLKVVSVGHSHGLQLGHFITKNLAGQAAHACDIYEQVELVFFAGGMAVNGDSPKMTVIGACLPTENMNFISPIMISIDKIIETSAQDKEISDFSDSAISVKFENVSDSWPKIWILQSAKLISSQSGELKVDENDIRRLLGKAPYMDWQN